MFGYHYQGVFEYIICLTLYEMFPLQVQNLFVIFVEKMDSLLKQLFILTDVPRWFVYSVLGSGFLAYYYYKVVKVIIENISLPLFDFLSVANQLNPDKLLERDNAY